MAATTSHRMGPIPDASSSPSASITSSTFTSASAISLSLQQAATADKCTLRASTALWGDDDDGDDDDDDDVETRDDARGLFSS